MVKLKTILNDLIDYVYAEHPKNALFKKFYVECVNENRKSMHGVYNVETHHIRVFNMYREDSDIVATVLHELAHHVDQMSRGKTDHQKPFYDVFEQLLYGALDMHLFNKEEFLAANRNSSDSKKVTKMIENYIPSDADYKKNSVVISVNNGYQYKEFLKTLGFHYVAALSAWEKEIAPANAESVTSKLEAHDIAYETRNGAQISLSSKKKTIVAQEGSYEHRKELAAAGFRFVNKSWQKHGTREEYEEIKKRIPEVVFRLK